MSATVVQKYDSDKDVDDERLEIFCLIWLDANPNETRDTEQKLRSIINHLTKFQDVKRCQKYIEQRTHEKRLVLIVSGQLGQQIVPLIHDLRQVISIYVYCMDKKRNEGWAREYKKIKAVIVNLDELVKHISRDHKIQKKVEEPLPIDIFKMSTDAGKSTTGVKGQFIFFQLLIDCLLQLKSSEKDTNELVDCCKKEYEGNFDELENIDEFVQEYSSKKALSWYAKDSFLYKTLNAALRKQNIHMIILFRGFIHDIHRQLQKEQSTKRLRVYRGQMIATDELETLRNSLGQLISVNSFFSTSLDYDTAASFLEMSDATDKLKRVLFQIDADPKMITTKPFADISQYSNYNEKEVLFMIGSIFRLDSIDRSDDNVWIIRMTLCNDNEHDLKEVLIHMKQQLGSGETNLRTLGKILCTMGKFDLAEKYFNRLLEELSSDDPLLSQLYEDLAQLASQTGKYDQSVKWHQKALKFQNKRPAPVEPKPKETDHSTTNSPSRCCQCLQPIGNEQYTVVNQKKYHRRCFRCRQCNQAINEMGFRIENDEPYCILCQNLAQRCSQCLKSIFDTKSIVFNGKHYHSNCFRCSQCNQIIEESKFHIENNKLCCIRCYKQYLAPKCGECFKPIVDETAIIYDGKKYHANCFRCIECNQIINTTKFGSKNNKPVCVNCHLEDLAPKCYRCSKSINGKYSIWQGKNYHIECFTCDKCRRIISSNQGFYDGSSEVLCSKCIK